MIERKFDPTLNQKLINLETERSKELLLVATQGAEILLTVPGIDKVGISGGVAVNKPNTQDIDLWIFAKDEFPAENFLCYCGLIYSLPAYGLGYLFHTDKQKEEELAKMIDSPKNALGVIPWDINLLPSCPSESFLQIFIDHTPFTPNYLQSEIGKILIYNPITKKFERTEVFPKETLEIINRLTFKALKKMSNEPWTEEFEKQLREYLRKRKEIKKKQPQT